MVFWDTASPSFYPLSEPRPQKPTGPKAAALQPITVNLFCGPTRAQLSFPKDVFLPS